MVTGSPAFTWFGVMVRLLMEKIGLPVYGANGVGGYGVVAGPGVEMWPGVGDIPGEKSTPGPGVGVVVGNPAGGMVGAGPGTKVGTDVGICISGAAGLSTPAAFVATSGCFLRGGIATSMIMSKSSRLIMTPIVIHNQVGNMDQNEAPFTVKSITLPFSSAVCGPGVVAVKAKSTVSLAPAFSVISLVSTISLSIFRVKVKLAFSFRVFFTVALMVTVSPTLITCGLTVRSITWSPACASILAVTAKMRTSIRITGDSLSNFFILAS